jgi:hypothetical protein
MDGPFLGRLGGGKEKGGGGQEGKAAKGHAGNYKGGWKQSNGTSAMEARFTGNLAELEKMPWP